VFPWPQTSTAIAACLALAVAASIAPAARRFRHAGSAALVSGPA
jgi:hypothetical protein